MPKKPTFWYKEATAGPLDRDFAFAAAGALTAAGWKPGDSIEDGLDAVVGAAGASPIQWKYPAAVAAMIGDPPTATRLAGAWRDVHQHYSSQTAKVARLVVDTASLAGANIGRSLTSNISAVSRMLAVPSMQRRFGGAEDITDNCGDIASVAFTSFNKAMDHRWNWPLLVGIDDHADPRARQLSAIDAIDRGYVSCEIEKPVAQDVFVVTDPTVKELRNLQQHPLGLALVGTSLSKPTQSTARMVQRWMSGGLSVPAALVDLTDEWLPEWINYFSYGISYSKPLDQAVFDAMGAIWRKSRALPEPPSAVPPVVLAPEFDPSGTFDSARPSNRIKELIERMNGMPQDAVIATPKHLQIPEFMRDALGIPEEPRTVGDYQRNLSVAHASNNLDFLREMGGAAAIPALNRAIDTLESAAGEPPEPGRYTDVTLYNDELFEAKELADATKVNDETALSAGQAYTVGVAIRLKRTGIDSKSEARRKAINPRKDREDLTIYVYVRSKCPGVEIADPFRSIVWPYNKDSDTAFFRFKAALAAGMTTGQGELEVLVYHSSLDLLDVVRTELTVVDEGASTHLPSPRKLSWPDELPAVPLIEAKTPPRLASINVSSAPGGYQFDFKFATADGKIVAIPARRMIGQDDLKALLETVRNFWTRLVISNYAEDLTVSRTTFKKYMKELAEIGKMAARELLGDRSGEQIGAGETISQLLASIGGAEGGRLQITYSDNDAAGFVFPWNLVYPREAETGEADVHAFWGVRYQIEQVRSGPKSASLDEEPVDVSFALDPSFGNSQAQKDLFAGYALASSGKLVVSPPIDTAKDLFAKISNQPASHLYYFFCHGWAPGGFGVLPADSLRVLEESADKLPEEGKTFWRSLLSLLPKMGQQPWIFIGSSQVEASSLQNQKFFNRRRPIVFLNMCHSAALMPSMNSGFVRIFLDRNASAVVGTESPMTPIFAHAFAERVMNALLHHEDIGTALWQARRWFLDDNVRNPLGLAYTLYGRATTQLGRQAIVAAGSQPGAGNSS